MVDFYFDGRHLLVYFTVSVIFFLAGAIFGWIMRDEQK